jgi:hypothetical protein
MRIQKEGHELDMSWTWVVGLGEDFCVTRRIFR